MEEGVPPKAEAEAKPDIWARIKSLGSYGILLTIFMAGAVLTTIWWNTTVSNLQNDVRGAESELAKVKQEYAEYRGKHRTKNVKTQEKTNHNPTDIDSQKPSSDVGKNEISLTVETGNIASVNISGDQLSISLLGTVYEGKPPRYTVTAKISSPGFTVMEVEHLDIGDTITYNGKIKYEVRPVEIGVFSAKFLITPKIE
jgi:hypothetical protein